MYQHDAFQYNRPDLLVNLVRKKPASSQSGTNLRGPYSSSTNSTRGRLFGLSIPHQMDAFPEDNEASSPSSAQYGEAPRQSPHTRMMPHMAPHSLALAPASAASFFPATASGLGEEDGMRDSGDGEEEEEEDDDLDDVAYDAVDSGDHRGVRLSSDTSSHQREQNTNHRHNSHQHRSPNTTLNPNPGSNSADLSAAASLRTWDAALRYFGTPSKRSPDSRQPSHASGASSSSALGSLAPACEVSAAVLVVVEFCLAHDPWLCAGGLYAQVSALLSCKPALLEELGQYVSAMFPDERSPLTLALSSSAQAGAGAEEGAVCDNSTDRDSTSSGSVGGGDSPNAASSANRADKDSASVSGDSDITDESDAATLCASRVTSSSSSSSSSRKRRCEYRVGGEHGRKARRAVGGARGSSSGGVNEVFVVRSFVSFAISCLESLSGVVLDKAKALSSRGDDSSHADKLLSDLSGVQGSWVEYAQAYST